MTPASFNEETSIEVPRLVLTGGLKQLDPCSTDSGSARRIAKEGPPGVYLFTHATTGALYIGEAQNVGVRLRHEWHSMLRAAGWRFNYGRWTHTGQPELVQEPWIRRLQRRLLEEEMRGISPEQFQVRLLQSWAAGDVSTDERRRIQWEWIYSWLPDLNSLESSR